MASQEIVVTVGADTSQLEKGLKDVQKTAQKSSTESSSFASILGKAYGYAQLVSSLIKPILDFMVEYAERARTIKNLSVASGMPIDKLQQYESVAKNAGISLQTFAHSMAEFNKRIGEAKIRGTEANASLTKLGFGLKDITNGNLKYEDALYALADAFQAGTDEATLMHYGVQLFGSSFEQLLPIIKQGSGEIKKQMEAAYSAEPENVRAAARFANFTDRITQLWDATMIDIVGITQNFGEDITDELNNTFAGIWYAAKRIFVPDKDVIQDAATEIYKQMSPGKSKEERQKYYDYWMKSYGIESDDEKKIFMDKIAELEGGKGGKKLSPLGLTEAQGASQMQQMGGGDIVSAIAFTPLERIAAATEETAKNTAPEKNQVTEPSPVMGSNIPLGF